MLIRLTPDANELVFACLSQWLFLSPLKEQGKRRLKHMLGDMHKNNETEFAQLGVEAESLEREVADFSLECNAAQVTIHLETSQVR